MFVNNHSHRLTQTATTNPFMLDEFVVMGAHGECEAFAASKNIEAKYHYFTCDCIAIFRHYTAPL